MSSGGRGPTSSEVGLELIMVFLLEILLEPIHHTTLNIEASESLINGHLEFGNGTKSILELTISAGHLGKLHHDILCGLELVLKVGQELKHHELKLGVGVRVEVGVIFHESIISW